MKKLFCAILSMAMLLTLLAGCDLFTTPTTTAAPQGDPNPSSTAGEVDTSIKMSDNYTFTDPEDLTFKTRYALFCDETSASVATAASYGVKAMYSIMYADENDIPVGCYEFMVCDTAENAQTVIELYASFGTALTAAEEDPCVLYSFAAADTVEAMLISFQASGVISEATASAYMEYYKTYSGGTMLE